jgi:hypothetical protein
MAIGHIKSNFVAFQWSQGVMLGSRFMASDQYPPQFPPDWILSGSLTESYTPWNLEGTTYYIEYGTPDYIECQTIWSAWQSSQNRAFFITLVGDTAPLRNIRSVGIRDVNTGIIYGNDQNWTYWIYMTDPNADNIIIAIDQITRMNGSTIPPSGTYTVIISYDNGRPDDESVWTFGLNSNEWVNWS